MSFHSNGEKRVQGSQSFMIFFIWGRLSFEGQSGKIWLSVDRAFAGGIRNQSPKAPNACLFLGFQPVSRKSKTAFRGRGRKPFAAASMGEKGPCGVEKQKSL